MNSTITKNDDNTVTLTVVYDGEPWKKIQKKILNDSARSMNLKGFRKGHVPPAVIRKMFGAQTLMEWAAEQAADSIADELLNEYDLVPADRVLIDFENVSPEAATILFTVPQAPQASVGDWKSLNVSPMKTEVEEEEVQKMIDQLCEEEAEMVTIEEPAQEGDSVSLEVEALCDGEAVENLSLDDDSYVLGSNTWAGADFDQQITGITADETRTFTVVMPEDDEELAGKTVEFTVRAGDVFRKKVPAFDDALVQKLYVKDISTADALKERIRGNLNAKLHADEEKRFYEEMCAAVTGRTEVEVPESMIQTQITLLMNSMNRSLQRQGLSLDGYMRLLGLSEEEMREQLRDQAKDDVTYSLALDAIAQAENVEVSEEEIRDYAEQAGIQNQAVSLPVLRQTLRRQKAEDLVFDANSPAEEVEIEAEETETE